MKLLFWIVGVPLLLIAAFFAIANRESVAVSLWPLADAVNVPLFIAIVGPLYLGFLLGAGAAWIAGGRARSRAREAARRVAALDQENTALRARLDQATPGQPVARLAERETDLPVPLP
jgi:lipopolysaccharide assembly protein A